MKTTVEISNSLLEQSKNLAVQESTTLRALIEEGLREVIAKHETKRKFRLRKESFKGKGLQPAFQGASWNEIRAAAYESHGG